MHGDLIVTEPSRRSPVIGNATITWFPNLKAGKVSAIKDISFAEKKRTSILGMVKSIRDKISSETFGPASKPACTSRG